MGRMFIALGALNGFVGVAAGAFGAHALKERLSAQALNTFEVGVRYHLVHALALVLVGALAAPGGTSLLRASGWAFQLGVLLFSGSLYALALTGVTRLGIITPLGGLAFLAGWTFLAGFALRS